MKNRIRNGGSRADDAYLAQTLDAERADLIVVLVDEDDLDVLDVRMGRNMILSEIVVHDLAKAVIRYPLLMQRHVQFSESFEIEGREMFAHACKLGLEGVVSKVRDSAYASGRGNSWVKKTCAQRETLTIAGFALDEGKWDGIYVGRRKGDDLIYAGKVDHGFDKASAADLQKRLKPLIRRMQPYAKRIAHRGIWVEPKLLAEIEYRAKSAEGKVRHPFFKGLRQAGPLMNAYDRFWQWADKPLESFLTISAELHRAVMGLAPERWRDR